MTQTIPSRLHPRLQRTSSAVVGEWNRVGSQMRFYAATLGSIPD
ncbi:MAG: phospholipid/cholesterol/gamma-HCH transport system permease protein, partial [Mycobacterium sp.]|nr:phospholipid/cholesterol/gamma-HCH transport system permease protein [Mycobacterium sp.]